MAAHIQLQNVDGSVQRWIGERELQSLLEKRCVMRVSSRRDPFPAYRFRPLPATSESKTTHCQLTRHDEFALVGIHRVDEVWIERLIGFGLLPEGTRVPASGYLG